MSGSGGGGYIPPQKANFDCETSRIRTTVSSINLDVLNNHKVGDTLGVEISQNESLILVNNNGETLGSILHPNTVDIIECIKSGHVYEAEIISISHPSCIVIIRRI